MLCVLVVCRYATALALGLVRVLLGVILVWYAILSSSLLRKGVVLGLDERVKAIIRSKVLRARLLLAFAILGQHSNRAILTGIPELVLIPAPVTTTTFRDFRRASATVCRSSGELDSTCVVGMVLDATSASFER